VRSLLLPRARGLALGYKLSPASRATVLREEAGSTLGHHRGF
jgi:hypothetical protein